jgi:hypothetical protein
MTLLVCWGSGLCAAQGGAKLECGWRPAKSAKVYGLSLGALLATRLNGVRLHLSDVLESAEINRKTEDWKESWFFDDVDWHLFA